jgi:type VI secretion system secreted protein VgrG
MSIFQLKSGAIPEAAKTIGFEARERLGRPFTADVYLTCADAGALELLDVIGAKASLVVELPEQGPMAFHGHISAFSLLRMEGKLSLYRATLTPRLAGLAESSHSRVFTKLALRDIVAQVLSEYQLAEGTDFELTLADPPPTEEHVSQYKESDLDFLHRWMEREGWTYYFDQEGDVERVVIVDAKTAHTSLRTKAVRYFPQHEGDGTARDSFRELSRRSSATPAGIRIKDYDYMKPGLEVVGTAAISAQGLGELATYGARVFTPDAATRLARLRSEEVLARAITYKATGAAAHLRAGYTFDLYDHPRGSMNRAYLITEARHVGVEPSLGEEWGALLPKVSHRDVYSVEIDAIEAETQFRGASVTPWPQIDGFENATIDGPSTSPYAQIDDEGRYVLKLHYDESPNKDGNASTRVRMAQPHAGSVEGFHFPLRKGTEVICAFLGGDPDRPVIVGVVPNATTMSKVVDTNRTQNIVQTGSGNFFTLEDQKGKEWLNVFSPAGGLSANLYLGCARPDGAFGLTAQSSPDTPVSGPNAKDLGAYSAQLWTKGSTEICAGKNLNFIAGADMQIRAHGGEYRTYSAGPWFLDVVGAAKETYYGELTYKVTGSTKIHLENTENTHVQLPASYTHNNTLFERVAGDVKETYGATKTQHVFQTDLEAVLGDRTFVRKTYESEISGGDFQFVAGDQIVKSKAGETITVNGPKTETTAGNVDLKVTQAMNWNLGAHTFSAEYHSMFSSSASVIKGELVWGGTKESTVNGAHIEMWRGNRAAIALGVGYELHNTKIGVTLADVHFWGAKVNVVPLNIGFTGSAADHKSGPNHEFFAIRLFVHVLRSKT